MRPDLPQGGNLPRTRMGRHRHRQSLRGKTGSAVYILGELLFPISLRVHILHALTVDRGRRTTKSRSSAMCSSHVLAKNFSCNIQTETCSFPLQTLRGEVLIGFLKMITPQEIESVARAYVTLEKYIREREEELASLYRNSSAALVRTRRLVTAISRLGRTASFPTQRFEALVARHAACIADGERILADITRVQGQLAELHALFDPLWPIADSPAVARARHQLELESVLAEIEGLERRISRHRRQQFGKSFRFEHCTRQLWHLRFHFSFNDSHHARLAVLLHSDGAKAD